MWSGGSFEQYFPILSIPGNGLRQGYSVNLELGPVHETEAE